MNICLKAWQERFLQYANHDIPSVISLYQGTSCFQPTRCTFLRALNVKSNPTETRFDSGSVLFTMS